MEGLQMEMAAPMSESDEADEDDTMMAAMSTPSYAPRRAAAAGAAPPVQQHAQRDDVSHSEDAFTCIDDEQADEVVRDLAILDGLVDEASNVAELGSARFSRSAPPSRSSCSINPFSSMMGSLSSVVTGLGARRRSRSHSNSSGGAAPTPPPVPPAKPTTPPVADEPWLVEMEKGYRSGGLDGALAAFDDVKGLRPSEKDKPSTFIRMCELLHHCGAETTACADVLFNVLETKLPDMQTCRVVAYHLLSLECFDDAVRLLSLLETELAPAEPHSHSDIAFARLLRLRKAEGASASLEHATIEIKSIVDALTKVITSTEWPDRFCEIEWPALIVLSWAVAWAEHTYPSLKGAVWPEEHLEAATFRVGGSGGPMLDIFVWLGWDTDHTDVDLHVKEPTGEEVNYSHNKSATTGARVSRDFTGGFGPEVYTLPKAPTGIYQVETNYYASHQASATTGATSAVIWSVQHMGRFDKEVLQFSSVRLTTHKQRQQVLELVVP